MDRDIWIGMWIRLFVSVGGIWIVVLCVWGYGYGYGYG